MRINHAPYQPRKYTTYARKYQVKPGESLRTIATTFYGNKDKWVLIYNANRRQIEDPDILTPGQILVIPQDTSR